MKNLRDKKTRRFEYVKQRTVAQVDAEHLCCSSPGFSVEMEYVFLYVTASLDRVVETEKQQMGVRSRLACLLSKAWIVNSDLLLI